jgi:hypothetical protein
MLRVIHGDVSTNVIPAMKSHNVGKYLESVSRRKISRQKEALRPISGVKTLAAACIHQRSCDEAAYAHVGFERRSFPFQPFLQADKGKWLKRSDIPSSHAVCSQHSPLATATYVGKRVSKRKRWCHGLL